MERDILKRERDTKVVDRAQLQAKRDRILLEQYEVVATRDSMDHARWRTEETVAWYERERDEARRKVRSSEGGGEILVGMLKR